MRVSGEGPESWEVKASRWFDPNHFFLFFSWLGEMWDRSSSCKFLGKRQRLTLTWLSLVDPPCLCLQQVVSKVQRNESEIMHTLAGVLYNWNVSLEAAII